MTRTEIIEGVTRLDSNKAGAPDALSNAIVQEGRNPVRAVVGLLNSSDPTVRANAASVAGRLEDLAVGPLLEAPDPRDVFQRVWMLQTIVDAHVEVRGKIVALLKENLANKTSVPWQHGPKVEETPLPSRVCDETYLLMRRLLNLSEDRTQYIASERAFLRLSDAEKDAKILKAKESREWTNLLPEEW